MCSKHVLGHKLKGLISLFSNVSIIEVCKLKIKAVNNKFGTLTSSCLTLMASNINTGLDGNY